MNCPIRLEKKWHRIPYKFYTSYNPTSAWFHFFYANDLYPLYSYLNFFSYYYHMRSDRIRTFFDFYVLSFSTQTYIAYHNYLLTIKLLHKIFIPDIVSLIQPYLDDYVPFHITYKSFEMPFFYPIKTSSSIFVSKSPIYSLPLPLPKIKFSQFSTIKPYVLDNEDHMFLHDLQDITYYYIKHYTLFTF